MEKVEYKVLTVKTPMTTESELNDLAADGWRVVATSETTSSNKENRPLIIMERIRPSSE